MFEQHQRYGSFGVNKSWHTLEVVFVGNDLLCKIKIFNDR